MTNPRNRYRWIILLSSLSLGLAGGGCADDGDSEMSVERDAGSSEDSGSSEDGSGQDTGVIRDEVAPGSYDLTLEHDGVERTYTVHIPTGYTPEDQYALVFLLHGGLGTAEQITSSTDLAAHADTHGYLLVAPNGLEKQWNHGAGVGPELTQDDVGFIDALVDHLIEAYAIDPARIYSTGLSSGGFMSQRLACDLPGTFAAIAPLASPMYEEFAASCEPEPIPVLGIQGTEDPFFPIFDDNGIPELPRILERQGVQQRPLEIDEVTAFWPNVNGCAQQASVRELSQDQEQITTPVEYTFEDCSDGQSVVYYIVYGMGHTWPGAEGEDGGSGLSGVVGDNSQNLDANDVIWEFFQQHRL